MKLTGLSQQYDTGRDIRVDRSDAHVRLAVDATEGSGAGEALLTPAQARAVADMLFDVAREADEIEWSETS